MGLLASLSPTLWVQILTGDHNGGCSALTHEDFVVVEDTAGAARCQIGFFQIGVVPQRERIAVHSVRAIDKAYHSLGRYLTCRL